MTKEAQILPRTNPGFAVRTYGWLVALAVGGQPETNYLDLTNTLGGTAAAVATDTDESSSCCGYWCNERGLPKLTHLVVKAASDEPSSGSNLLKGDDHDVEVQKVREYPWLDLVGPTLAELEGIADDLRQG